MTTLNVTPGPGQVTVALTGFTPASKNSNPNQVCSVYVRQFVAATNRWRRVAFGTVSNDGTPSLFDNLGVTGPVVVSVVGDLCPAAQATAVVPS